MKHLQESKTYKGDWVWWSSGQPGPAIEVRVTYLKINARNRGTYVIVRPITITPEGTIQMVVTEYEQALFLAMGRANDKKVRGVAELVDPLVPGLAAIWQADGRQAVRAELARLAQELQVNPGLVQFAQQLERNGVRIQDVEEPPPAEITILVGDEPAGGAQTAGPERKAMLEVIHDVWHDGDNSRSRDEQNHIMEQIWALSDGYGEPGFIPAQGYDWSGIRDSSDVAVRRMYEVARKHSIVPFEIQRVHGDPEGPDGDQNVEQCDVGEPACPRVHWYGLYVRLENGMSAWVSDHTSFRQARAAAFRQIESALGIHLPG